MSDGPDTIAAAPALEAPSLFDQLASRVIAAGGKGTQFGITAKLLGDFMRYQSAASADELAAVTEPLAREILYRRVWLTLGLDKLPAPIAAALFDVALRKTNEEAGKLLQKAIGTTTKVALKVDGRIGRETLTAIEQIIKDGNAVALAEQVLSHRNTFVFRLFDGKLFGRDIDVARAAIFVGKAAIFAKTGVKL